MKPLVVIPARGGSKGIPRKNIKLLGGKPLIHYAIQAAQALFENDVICVSTDDPEIAACAAETGIKIPFLRPAELASDTAGSYEVLLHAIQHYEAQGYAPDTLILLQPTSPFRTAAHIKAALDLYATDLDMVVSAKETRANPYYVLYEENEHGFLEKSKTANFTRRQDVPTVYELNGAVYIINIESLKKHTIGNFKNIKKYVMDERSSADLDEPLDWLWCEFLLQN